MNVGISTACIYPMETEKAIEILLSMDFKLFEIFINTFREMEPQYIHELSKSFKEHGAYVKSIHPFTSGFESMLLFSEYLRRFEDGLEFYKRYFETANILGAKIVVLHGQRDYLRGQISEEVYFERYAKLRETGLQFGVEVAQENVNAFRSEDPAFILRMRRYLHDQCSFVFDIKQAIRAGVNAFQMCQAMGERIVHIHLNDNDASHDCLLPGCGTMDFREIRTFLQNTGYDGDIIIEVYRRNFQKIEELKNAKKTAEQFVSGGFLGKHLQA